MTRPAGFTLVELLVTTSLMALVGGVTVGGLSGGFRVWERAGQFEAKHQAAVLVAAEQFRRDVRNVRRFAPVGFAGAYDQYAFPAVEDAEPGDERPAELGRRGYFLDERHHRLCRAFTPYPQVEHERLRDRCQTVMEDVTRVRFSYFGKDPDSGAVQWLERWDAPRPPLAVQAELTMQTAGGAPVSRPIFVTIPGASLDDDPPAAPPQ